MLFDEENDMKSKIVITIIILLISGLAFFHIPFCSREIPQGFAPTDVLYHGSTNANIKLFESRSTHIRDKEEGPVVFATPSLKLASCYLFRWDDSWVHQSISWKDSNKADYQVVMVISDKTKFEREDQGGAIYILPSQGFDFDEHKGLGIYELTHKGTVAPMLKIDFPSALVAMKKLGVKVYFVKQDQFQHYLSLPRNAQEKFLK
jgi:hypothetical protein